jgi:hypothetical protein
MDNGKRSYHPLLPGKVPMCSSKQGLPIIKHQCHTIFLFNLSTFHGIGPSQMTICWLSTHCQVCLPCFSLCASLPLHACCERTVRSDLGMNFDSNVHPDQASWICLCHLCLKRRKENIKSVNKCNRRTSLLFLASCHTQKSVIVFAKG